MNQQTNQLSDDNDIEILSSLVNGAPTVCSMDVDSITQTHTHTNTPTQVPEPTTIDKKLDFILAKMDKLDTMVNYRNAAMAALSKFVAKDQKYD